MMISQSGTFYKIIVTSCVLLGVNHLSLSTGSPVVAASNTGVAPTSLSHALFNLQYPPSGPTGSGLFFTSGDIAAAESGTLFGDGALVSHSLHGLLPDGRLEYSNVAPGGNQFAQSVVPPPQVDDLQTAGQSYFIEPPQPSTTTIKPTFKKRKTRRPITSLADKSRQEKEIHDNMANNEEPSGNKVSFRPNGNTSFGGRKRPSSDNKQEGRTRTRANVANQPAGSTLDANNEPKSNDNSLNEIQKTEGEPRLLGRRKPPQDARTFRPTSTAAAAAAEGGDSNVEQPPRGRRFPLRRPRPSFDAPTGGENSDDGAENANPKPLRPRLGKRLRPRPTTTITVPATETDTPTDITDPDPVTIFHQNPTSPQPVPTGPEFRPRVRAARPVVVNRFANANRNTVTTGQSIIDTGDDAPEAKSRVRPARPPVINRFANANRNTATTTASPSDAGDESPISSLPPASFPRRRPLRPTTRQQSLTTSTEAPEDILGNIVHDDAPAPGTRGGRGGAGRGDGSQKPLREGRQGFLLRPRPTPDVATQGPNNAQDQNGEIEEGIRRPLSNRRRKRPTTTVTSAQPSSSISPAVSYNQAFVGGIVEENVIPPSERFNHGRRINPILRTQPTPLPVISATGGPPSYQIRDEQPVIQPIRTRSENHEDISSVFISNQQGAPAPISIPSSFRRPTGPSGPASVGPQAPSMIQQGFNNNNPGLIDPHNFVQNFQFPAQHNLGLFPSGFDNQLGVPSNFRSIQHLPVANEFSSRSTNSEEPEISHNDFSPAASTEKQSISPSNNNAESADSPPSAVDSTAAVAADQEKPAEAEKKVPPVKLSPLERLHQNRQAAAKKLLASSSSRKPTEKTTTVPPATPAVKKSFNNFRKSLIPPRMLRPRGKLPGSKTAEEQDKPIPNDGRENDSGAAEEKLANNEDSAVAENINEPASSAETDKEDNNTIPSSPAPEEVSTRKPTLLEAAKRRRVVPSALAKSAEQQQQKQQQQKVKITPAPAPAHDVDAALPECEDGQRYSKFLKRCVTMYKPRVLG